MVPPVYDCFLQDDRWLPQISDKTDPATGDPTGVAFFKGLMLHVWAQGSWTNAQR
jgi:hypothetical protein